MDLHTKNNQFTRASVLLFLLLVCNPARAEGQGSLPQFLANNHYSFDLASGFDSTTTILLKKKLTGYKLILQAEGGSHSLNIYARLPYIWISFLQEQFGLTHFFFEAGHSTAILKNTYLQTGDTAYLTSRYGSFWTNVRRLNESLPDASKIKHFGIDFERPATYGNALKILLPQSEAPSDIKDAVNIIKSINDTLRDCNAIISINKVLKKSLVENETSYQQYIGNNFNDYERIILTRGNCTDIYKNRNKNMAENFLAFDKLYRQSVYFGELGEAHTVLIHNNTAAILNKSKAFENKVCVINLYCYNCKTPDEEASNWPLQKIEKDILTYFIPFCKSDFTIFDLSDPNPLTRLYSAYGQFLIIAKNQQ